MNQPTIQWGDISGIAANGVENGHDWLSGAVIAIDDAFGAGSAEANPVAVAGFMLASAISYHADRQLDAAEIIAKAIAARRLEKTPC